MKKLWKNHKLLVIGIPCVLAAAVVVGILIFNYRRSVQVRACIDEANRYLSELDYEQAIASYRQALDIDEKNREANLGLAEAYDANNMSVYAENVYKSMLEQDSGQADVYEKLADLYIRDNKLDEARELLDTAMSQVQDEAVTKLYYVARPEPPTSSYDAGAYTDRIRVELIPSGERQTIYYTLDGSEPTEESTAYEKPIILKNGKTQVKAIVVNSTGYQSDIAVWDYDIQIVDVLVELEEPVIEQMVRQELQIPSEEPVYNDDIEQITELYVIGTGIMSFADRNSVYLKENTYTIDGYEYGMSDYGRITTLNDLQYMPFLERVVVTYQPDLDISALSRCTGLKELCLVGDELNSRDIAVLGGLTGLEKLNLGWNQIQDISVLSGLTNLKSLGVWGNQVRDLQPVAGLTNLEYLDFSDNDVQDMTPVAGLTQLKELWMYYNRISDISAVSGLSKLEVLMLRDNPISNPEAVRSIYPHLTRIDTDILKLGGEE